MAGDSGDTQPYAVEREIEDLAALPDTAHGSVMVFGGSSGAGLALLAAAQNSATSKLAVWEPPYHVDDSAPRLPHDFMARLDAVAGQPVGVGAGDGVAGGGVVGAFQAGHDAQAGVEQADEPAKDSSGVGSRPAGERGWGQAAGQAGFDG